MHIRTAVDRMSEINNTGKTMYFEEDEILYIIKDAVEAFVPDVLACTHMGDAK